jgi:hypothetical protein
MKLRKLLRNIFRSVLIMILVHKIPPIRKDVMWLHGLLSGRSGDVTAPLPNPTRTLDMAIHLPVSVTGE